MVKEYKKSGITSKLRASYKKRKDGIKKKASQLATLCDVNMCVVCIGPEGDIESWPENPCEVRSVIEMYKDYQTNGKNKKKQGARFDKGSKKEVFVNLSSVVDEKLKQVKERIDFLNFMNDVQNDYQTVPYCAELTTNNECLGVVNNEIESDTYEQDMIWDELEQVEEKTTNLGFSSGCSTIVSEGSCGGSISSPFVDCYALDPVEIDMHRGEWKTVFEWDGGDIYEIPKPIW